MKKHLLNKKVDCLLFKYLHFYGSYDYVGTSQNWYPNEVRIIRNDQSFYSYKDAQGFRKGENEKLKVKSIDAYVYHYGWVKDPRIMQNKQRDFNKLWHDDGWVEKHIGEADLFDYMEGVRTLHKFKGTHPKVMLERIDRINWKFDYNLSFNKRTFKYVFKAFFKNYLGLDFNYTNYTKV